MDDIRSRLTKINARMSAALQRCGRQSGRVQLVAASKFQPAAVMAEYISAARSLGIDPLFGESYVQEFRKKKAALEGECRCHLIGALQRNKAREAVRLFDLIEAVHSAEVAQALNDEAARIEKLLPVFLQINISRDPAKAGFAPGTVRDFIAGSLPGLSSLRLCGLMTITRDYCEPEETRADYRAMFDLRERLAADPDCLPAIGPQGLELSMGMSGDFEMAIEEGATLVRIGTAIFGEREAP